ncbi:hypothetical protein KKB64_02250 [Patescibacteria group bacterium]|nr:hypothetical protein [Patescibacteria group bacterium]MBU1472590.1 hypothetical protein [Patescibacteria group bacterium]MBU2459841.1 hypothetical protein [Patescibacteria group bacterium]MBU2544098.1 hypothetical protein [Patescibacteria group bacterium]
MSAEQEVYSQRTINCPVDGRELIIHRTGPDDVFITSVNPEAPDTHCIVGSANLGPIYNLLNQPIHCTDCPCAAGCEVEFPPIPDGQISVKDLRQLQFDALKLSHTEKPVPVFPDREVMQKLSVRDIHELAERFPDSEALRANL